MATYTVTINEQTAEGKSVLTLLQSMKRVVKIRPSAIDESLLEVKHGKIHYAKDAKDLIDQCSK